MTNVIKQLVSEFWIPVPELKKAMQDRHQWRLSRDTSSGRLDDEEIINIYLLFILYLSFDSTYSGKNTWVMSSHTP